MGQKNPAMRVDGFWLDRLRMTLQRKMADRLKGEAILPPDVEERPEGPDRLPVRLRGEPGFSEFYESLSNRDLVNAALMVTQHVVTLAEPGTGVPLLDQWAGPEVARLEEKMRRLAAADPWSDALKHEYDALDAQITQARRHWRESVRRHADLVRAGELDEADVLARVMVGGAEAE